MNAELRDVLELLNQPRTRSQYGGADDMVTDLLRERAEIAERLAALSRPVVPDGDGDMRADAERYRYLRRPDAWREHDVKRPGSVSAIFVGTDAGYAEAYDGEALDAAIDAARSAAQEK